MIIQDIIFTCCSVMLNLALIPSLRNRHKPDWKTSLMTAIVLLIMALTYFSLNLYGAGALGLLTSLLWTILLIQWIRLYRKDSNIPLYTLSKSSTVVVNTRFRKALVIHSQIVAFNDLDDEVRSMLDKNAVKITVEFPDQIITYRSTK